MSFGMRQTCAVLGGHLLSSGLTQVLSYDGADLPMIKKKVRAQAG